MKKENEKGFTLIELLAVIVILAVIAVIVTPMIMGTINSARSSALKSSAQGIVHAAETYCARKQVSGGAFASQSFAINEATAKEVGFSYNTELTGTLAISSDCKVAIAVANANYQATKKQEEDDITVANKAANFDDLSKSLALLTPESCFTTLDNGDGTVTINGYTCSATDIVIPGTIGGKSVTKIENKRTTPLGAVSYSGDNYSSNSIDNLKLSPYIETNNLSLQKLFASSGSVSYTHIASKLTSVDFSNMSKLVTISDRAFESNKITSINLSGLTSLTSIGNYAFADNNITSLDLTDLTSLEFIYDESFAYNNITSLNLSGLNSLKYIGYSAFRYNSLKEINLKDLPSLVTIDAAAFLRYKGTYTFPDGSTITYNSCSPTITLDNVPNVAAYNSTDYSGLHPFAFGALSTDECDTSSTTSVCDSESAPTVIRKNTVSSQLQGEFYKIVVGWQCSI